ncbi:hypothetical protein [Sulfolobus sp. E11-6]|uniref:hypothetical protein n=1 Tax=Sulfolobus sp. E11-6 TaxID=2663020 RepID=UPI0012959BE6|nr:hypothetical protein [Sulfolobus sp. E11-6]QGA69589.1 hypothetical protein GFS33_13640 [Sulfolobus sp. E11-6]
MKRVFLLYIIGILLTLFLPLIQTQSAVSLPPLYVEDAVNAEIQQLWSKSPTGVYAFHEAPSVNNSFWPDDNAKFLESIAPWWQSYSSYVNSTLQFLQQAM